MAKTQNCLLQVAQDASPTCEPESYQLLDALHAVVNKIGTAVCAVPAGDDWYRCFSSGVARPFLDDDGSDNVFCHGFYKRCVDSSTYIHLESEYLHGDVFREHSNYGARDIEIKSKSRLQTLALRIVVFSLARAELSAQGFSIPDNPEIEKATIAVQAELAKDPVALAQFKALQQAVAGHTTLGSNTVGSEQGAIKLVNG